MYEYTVGGIGIVLIMIGLIGFIDHRFFSHNERFRLGAFGIVFMYIMDIVSNYSLILNMTAIQRAPSFTAFLMKRRCSFY